VVFDEESMLQERSETEDNAQGGVPDSSTDSHVKEVEFSDGPKKPDGSDEDPSKSDGDEQEATQQQHRLLRGQLEFQCHQQDMAGKMIMSYSH